MAAQWLRSREPRWLLLQLLTVYVLLGGALWNSDGALGPAAAVLLVLSLGLLVSTLRQPLPSGAQLVGGAAALPVGAWVGLLAVPAILGLLSPGGRAMLPTVSLWPYALTTLLLFLLTGYGLRRQSGWGPALLLLGIYLAAGLLLLHDSPAPRIDVFTMQQEGAAGLLAGHDPYALGFTNVYSAEETVRYWGRAVPLLPHYPYPPLSLLFTTASYALGHDVRLGLLLMQLVVGALLFALTRRRSPSLAYGLLGLHLLHPRGLFVLEQAWTEPLYAGCYALWATFLLRRPPARWSTAEWVGHGLLLGLLLASKQYSVLLLPLIWLGRFGGSSTVRRSVGLAIGLAALSLVPFALWHPHDFVDDVVLAQLRQPFRPDALSLTGVLHYLSGWRPSGALALLGALGGLRLCAAGLPRGTPGLLLAAPVLYLSFFATAKQAFCNYYYLGGVLLLFAAAALFGQPSMVDESLSG